MTRLPSLREFETSSASDEQVTPTTTEKNEEEAPQPFKMCCSCKATKPRLQFSKDSTKNDGLQSMCKVCMSDYHRHKRPRKDSLDQDVDEADEEKEEHDHEPLQKQRRGDHLYVFKNSRLPEYKIGRSSNTTARSHQLQSSQNFYMETVAVFENRGYLEGKVRTMLAYCLLPPEVAAGKEWHACSLQTALAAIGQAIESEPVNE